MATQPPPDQEEALPTPETQAQVASYTVLDRQGQPHKFQDLYNPPNPPHRTLIIFIRHFFCGSCQEYIRSLSPTLTPDTLARAPVPTALAIIGCGDPALIDAYAAETACPFAIYADPSRKLYEALGMASTLALGPRPEYIRKGFVRVVAESVWQTLKQVPSGLAMKGGDSRQVGGEVLFERGAVTWCHRMTTTRDHTEVARLAEILLGKK
nr:hypothetical protein [Aspergillus sp.]